MLCARLVEIGEVEMEKMILKFHHLLLVGKVWPFILTNLNSLLPRMFCAKFSWNWPSGFGEDDEKVKNYDNDDDGQGKNCDQKI